MQSNPYRLVVEIRKAGNSSEHNAVADLPKSTSLETQPALLPTPSNRSANKLDGQLRVRLPKFRLVLDAGHGGWDLGTVGRKGLMEKDLVLDIVHRLGELVESHLSAEVLYTRQDDTYLPLEKRTEMPIWPRPIYSCQYTRITATIPPRGGPRLITPIRIRP